MKMTGLDVPNSVSGGVRTFTLPFTVPTVLQSLFRIVRHEAPESSPRIAWGDEVDFEWSGDGTQVLISDPDGEILEDIWLGFTYESSYRFSNIHFKEEQNGNQVPTEVGKLTIKRLDVLYTGTLYFRAEVTPRNRDTHTYVMTPYIVGDPTPLEDVGPGDGKFSIPINAANDKYTCDIINDSVVQSRIQSAEWTGQYTIPSRRA